MKAAFFFISPFAMSKGGVQIVAATIYFDKFSIFLY